LKKLKSMNFPTPGKRLTVGAIKPRGIIITNVFLLHPTQSRLKPLQAESFSG
jgi:hypothetical protein